MNFCNIIEQLFYLTVFIPLIVKNLESNIKPLAIDFMMIYSGVPAEKNLLSDRINNELSFINLATPAEGILFPHLLQAVNRCGLFGGVSLFIGLTEILVQVCKTFLQFIFCQTIFCRQVFRSNLLNFGKLFTLNLDI